MKIIIRFLYLIPVIVLTVSCGVLRKQPEPATKVSRIPQSGEVPDGSLIYALPMTVFNITVEFQRSVEKPGPYARYASEMLGLTDIITRESEKWAVTGIGVKALEELDPSEFYVIESNTVAETNALALKRSGLILDISPAAYSTGIQPAGEGYGQVQITFSDLGADEYFMSQSDTAYRLVKLDTSFIRVPYLVERKKPLSVEQLADRAAKALLELRDGKQFILTGEANIFPQSSAGIDEINRLEKEYTALFAGKRSTEIRRAVYTFIPKKETGTGKITLFRLSENAGPLDPLSTAGQPVTIELFPAGKIKDITIVNRPAGEGENPVTFDKLFYRIPEVVTMKISHGSKIYHESRKLVYQLGQVVQLPANFIIGK